jgi:ABC transport system ATP-binding/permease protein
LRGSALHAEPGHVSRKAGLDGCCHARAHRLPGLAERTSPQGGSGAGGRADGGGLGLTLADDLVEVAGVHRARRVEDPGLLDGRAEVAPRQAVAAEFDGELGHGHADGDLVHADLELAGLTDPGVGAEEPDRAGCQGVAGAGDHHRLGELVAAQDELGAGVDEGADPFDPGAHDREIEPGAEPAWATDDRHRATLGLGSVESGMERVDRGVAQDVGLAVVEAQHSDLVDQLVGERLGERLGSGVCDIRASVSNIRHGPERSGVHRDAIARARRNPRARRNDRPDPQTLPVILVDAKRVTMTRPERDLFRDVSLTLSTGDRLGIVGINGTGKSTLMRVLAATETPESGEVRHGRGIRIAVLEQDPRFATGTVREAVGAGWEGEAALDRLGLGPLLDAPVAGLSGGETKRVALARTLMADADLLILDEPTNHLDLGAIRWLEDRLADFRGGLLLVTHDRHVLDRITTRVLELDRGGYYLHEGGYDTYLDGKAGREEAAQKAETTRRVLARQELAWLRRGAPARTSKPKAHIERAKAVVDAAPPPGQGLRSEPLVLHRGTPRLGDKVVELAGVGHRVANPTGGDRVLFSRLDLVLDPRERLGIVGLNGAGKSTLLNIIATRLTPTEGTVVHGPTVRLGYYDQQGADLDPTLRTFQVLTGGEEPNWFHRGLMESFWFDDDAQRAPVGLLSGGERRRLQLVAVLAAQPNVLLLDEPTNDLDLDTLRSLEDFLDEWPGALLVVSHDRAFLERTVADVIVLDGAGRAGRYRGGYAAWEADQHLRAGRRAETASSRDAKPSSAKSGGAARPSAASGGGRSLSTIQHELKAAERELTKATGDRDRLVEALTAAGSDHEKVRLVGAELATAQERLDAAEERWLSLAEELETRRG